MRILGIDPGKSGSMVLLNQNAEPIVTIKMPETPKDILQAIEELNPDICYLEDVGQGMPGQSSKATATFARHNGHLEMALLAKNVQTLKVTPAKWQKALSLLSRKGEEKKNHKNRIKAFSQQLFPTQKVTLINADAFAIAYYGWTQTRKP